MVRGLALTVGLLAAVPAVAGEMSAEEARRFVIGKMFNYTCFEGTRGLGRVNADGSVTGSIQFQGSGEVRHWTRFEHAEPNDLWQMDFKGHFAMRQGRCHPLTVLDDHSRYALELGACDNERSENESPHPYGRQRPRDTGHESPFR